jgi:hypothetical protein
MRVNNRAGQIIVHRVGMAAELMMQVNLLERLAALPASTIG